MPYYLILALQGFCIYHLYKNRNENYWFFVIIFIPVIGSIIYLITRVFNKNHIDVIQNEITTIINPTKKIKDLENALQFSETFQNRVNLADEYLKISDYNNAITHYEKSLEGTFKNDEYVTKQLIEAYYQIDNFSNVISYSEKINHHSNFTKSRSQFLYGLALEKLNKFDEAEIELRKTDISYSNYEERLSLIKFLVNRNKIDDAKEIINEILAESQHITSQNKRTNSRFFIEAEKLNNEL